MNEDIAIEIFRSYPGFELTYWESEEFGEVEFVGEYPCAYQIVKGNKIRLELNYKDTTHSLTEIFTINLANPNHEEEIKPIVDFISRRLDIEIVNANAMATAAQEMKSKVCEVLR